MITYDDDSYLAKTGLHPSVVKRWVIDILFSEILSLDKVCKVSNSLIDEVIGTP